MVDWDHIALEHVKWTFGLGNGLHPPSKPLWNWNPKSLLYPNVCWFLKTTWKPKWTQNPNDHGSYFSWYVDFYVLTSSLGFQKFSLLIGFLANVVY